MTKNISSLVKTNKSFRVMLVFFAFYLILSVSVYAEIVKQNSQVIKEALSEISDEVTKLPSVKKETQKIPLNVNNFPVDEKQRLKESITTNTEKKAIGKNKLKNSKQDSEVCESGSENSEFAIGADDLDSLIADNNNVSNKANNVSTNPNNLKQTKTDKLRNVKVNWFNTKIKAKDLGVNSQGDLYIVGLDGKLYKYEFLSDTWCLMEGDFDLTRINRVDVNWDGMPYVTTDIGDTFFLGCDHKWTRLPGCATDIGIGRGGEVYKTGCDKRKTGFGIYKLYCTCPKTCCYKGCQNWKNSCRFSWTHKDDDRKCEWFRIEGNGIKIDVAPSGNPYTIDVTGTILQYDGTNWRKVVTPTLAFDLTISNEGILFYTGQDGKIYKNVNESNGTWDILNGEADAISAGPFSQPWIIRNSDKSVLGSSKFEYN